MLSLSPHFSPTSAMMSCCGTCNAHGYSRQIHATAVFIYIHTCVHAVLYLFDLWPGVFRLWACNSVRRWQYAGQGIEWILLRMQHNSAHWSEQHAFQSKLIWLQYIFTSLVPLAAAGGTSTCTCNTDPGSVKSTQRHKTRTTLTSLVW